MIMNNDELYHFGVLGMRWGVKLSRDYRHGAKNRIKEIKSKNKVTDVKSFMNRHKLIKRAKADARIKAAQRLYPKVQKSTLSKVMKENLAKSILKSALMGSYGSLKYNESRGKKFSRIRSWLVGNEAMSLNLFSIGYASRRDYSDNRIARDRYNPEDYKDGKY